jgi:hypothetical protein
MLPRTLSLLGAAAAVAAIGATSAAAAPKTAIAYVQDGDVFLVGADGTGAHALTTDGTPEDRYRRPRVAADGSVWALDDWQVVHLGAGGGRIGTIPIAPPKDSKGRDLQDIPEWLDLSPDGTRVAWSVTNLNCPEGEDCYADGFTGVVDLATGQSAGVQAGLTETSFLDDQRLIGIDEHWLGDVRVASPSGPPALWYNDRDTFSTEIGTPRQPAVAADKAHYATLRTVQGRGVGVFIYKSAAAATPSGLASPPQQLCVINNVDASSAGPSWSPDGRSVVVAQNDGLAAYDFADVHSSAECATKVRFTAIADKGAIEPDWGVVPGTVPDPPSEGGTPGTPAPGTPVTPATPRPSVPSPGVARPSPATGASTAAAGPKLTVGVQRLSAILKSGLKVRLSGLKAGRTKVVVKTRGATIGTQTVKVGAGGGASATVRLTAAGRKALRRARTATLTISAGGASATLKVKR